MLSTFAQRIATQCTFLHIHMFCITTEYLYEGGESRCLTLWETGSLPLMLLCVNVVMVLGVALFIYLLLCEDLIGKEYRW